MTDKKKEKVSCTHPDDENIIHAKKYCSPENHALNRDFANQFRKKQQEQEGIAFDKSFFEKLFDQKDDEMNREAEAFPSDLSYSTLDFVGDLLIETPKNYENYQTLSNSDILERLSVDFFNNGKHFLKHILSRIRNSNHPDYNPDYKFSIETLEEAEKNVKLLLTNKAANILNYFGLYRDRNTNLKSYSYEQWRINNPNLDSRFFENLDTEAKCYWYGFIFADGSITSGNDPSRSRYQIAIEISKKDIDHLIKFCEIIGLNIEKIGERIRSINGKNFESAYIIFTCKPMYQDLINLGLKDLKEDSELSLNLGDNNLSYSFLLGFYDGEGGEGTTRVYSSNYAFLSQIKRVYGLKAEIRKHEITEVHDSVTEDSSIVSTKPMYDLSLGAELLNKMMNSYLDGLQRKRKSFSEQCNAMELLKEKVKDGRNLKNLIETYGKTNLAKKLNVSYNTLDNLCDEWNIDATILSAIEKLAIKVENKENLIRIIETYGKDKASKELKTGYKTLEALMEEWKIDSEYLTVRERLKSKVGNKENLQKLVKNYSLTTLVQNFGVGRNTLKRLCDDWNIEI